MIAIPFKPEHLARLQAQPEQAVEIAALTPSMVAALEAADSWTILEGEEPLFCGGVVPYQDFGVLWTAVSSRAGARMLAITRMCRRYLALQRCRIETSVRADFDHGCRWAEVLGFHRENLEPAAGFDGADHYRYVRR